MLCCMADGMSSLGWQVKPQGARHGLRSLAGFEPSDSLGDAVVLDPLILTGACSTALRELNEVGQVQLLPKRLGPRPWLPLYPCPTPPTHSLASVPFLPRLTGQVLLEKSCVGTLICLPVLRAQVRGNHVCT